MSHDEVKKINYDIHPFYIFITTIGAVSALFGIYVFMEKYSLTTKIIIVMSICIVLLIVYVFALLLRLHKTKTAHNNLVDKYDDLRKNQKSLKDMIHDKNDRLDDLSSQNTLLKFGLDILPLVYQGKSQGPSNEKIEEVNEIVRKEKAKSY